MDPLNPKAGEWTATYDSGANKTKFTFYFTNSDTIKGYDTLKLYYDPLESASVTYVPADYQKQIDQTKLADDEKLLLKEWLQAFFLQSGGLLYAKVYYFTTYDQLKAYQVSINNPELVCVNFYSADIQQFADKNFRNWFSYNNETSVQIKALATTYINDNKLSNVVMVQSEQLFLPRFVSKYFGRVSTFIANNPQAFELQEVSAITDETRKSLYRDNYINFYSLINEDRKDFEVQVKDGRCLDGNEIDKVTTLNWIAIQSDHRLINVYRSNGGDNSKIDSLEASGKRPSVYSASLTNMFDSFVNRRLILDYTIKNFTVTQQQELEVEYSSDIQYNKSFNVLKHKITNNPPSIVTG